MRELGEGPCGGVLTYANRRVGTDLKGERGRRIVKGKGSRLSAQKVCRAPQPTHAAPALLCQTRSVPQDWQLKRLFSVAPHWLQACIRRPPAAVLDTLAKQSGHFDWS